MTHAEIRKRLPSFHDQELQLREVQEIRAHLPECQECAREVRELRALDALLARTAAGNDTQFAAAVMERVLDRAPAAEARPSYAGWWKVPAFALASCAAYALCVETGLLPSVSDQLASALAAQNEAQKLSTMLFGNSRSGSGEMLAMLLDGD